MQRRGEVMSEPVHRVKMVTDWSSNLISILVGLGMIFFVGVMTFNFGLLRQDSDAPFELDLRGEGENVTVTDVGFRIVAEIVKEDVTEIRFYDAKSGRIIGTILTAAPTEAEEAPE